MDSHPSLTPLGAHQALLGFARRRGKGALSLLLHAAVPQSLRADLLALIRINFLPARDADATADADVLLAPFCKPLGDGYFQLDPEVRRQALRYLGSFHAGEPVPRVSRVASFLMAYAEHRQSVPDALRDVLLRDWVEIQRWTAAAFLDATATAERLAEALKATMGTGKEAVAAQLGAVAAAVTIPLGGHADLLAYAQGLHAVMTDDADTAQRLLGHLPDAPVQVGSVVLPSPCTLLSNGEAETGSKPAETSQTSPSEKREKSILVTVGPEFTRQNAHGAAYRVRIDAIVSEFGTLLDIDTRAPDEARLAKADLWLLVLGGEPLGDRGKPLQDMIAERVRAGRDTILLQQRRMGSDDRNSHWLGEWYHKARSGPAEDPHTVFIRAVSCFETVGGFAKALTGRLHRWRNGKCVMPPSVSGDLIVAAPSLPPYVEHRWLEHDAIVDGLLAPDSKGPRAVFLLGAGGVGKSTLASAVAGDSAVRNRFSDGIMWLPAGFDRLSDRILADALAWEFHEVPTSFRHDGLPMFRRVLVIAEDVLRPNVIPALLWALGLEGKLLVTTRSEEVAHALDERRSSVISLGLMNAENSSRLISRLLPESEQDPVPFMELMKGDPLRIAVTARVFSSLTRSSRDPQAFFRNLIGRRNRDEDPVEPIVTLGLRNLSASARKLFYSMCRRARGKRMLRPTDLKDLRSNKRWKESLAELLKWGLVEDRGGDGVWLHPRIVVAASKPPEISQIILEETPFQLAPTPHTPWRLAGGVARPVLKDHGPNDWALVVGIDRYAGYPSLSGAQRDAVAFAEWLRDPNGGNVPAGQIFVLRSSQYPPAPTRREMRPEVEDFRDAARTMMRAALRKMQDADKRRMGRRLYLFFSGHGIALGSPPRDDVALLMADAAPDALENHVPGQRWAESFLLPDLFEEVVLFMDCDAIPVQGVKIQGPKEVRRKPDQTPGKRYLYGFAAKYGKEAYERASPGQPVQSDFTKALLGALRRGAVEITTGRISSQSLIEAVAQGMRDPVGEGPFFRTLGSENMVIAAGPMRLEMLRIEADERHLKKSIEVLDRDGDVVLSGTLTGVRGEARLPAGTYNVRVAGEPLVSVLIPPLSDSPVMLTLG